MNSLAQKIVGDSEATLRLFALIKSIAPSDATVLLTGESGCGKELYAREIHERSDRSEGPFIAINCGAIPSELLESQLFGHKKGAFTGAIADFKGKFQEAQKGTLFLDEIGDMPFEMQVKLLRVLQERNVTPIGSHQLIDIDVRVIAATHRDLEIEILEKRFREDLYFRLNILPVHLPPLRERSSEIPQLIEYFANKFKSPEKKAIRLSPSFQDLLRSFHWPGNVRELSNTIHRLSILYAGEQLDAVDVDPSMLPSGLRVKIEDLKVEQSGNLDLAIMDSERESNEEAVQPFQPDPVDSETEELVLLAQGLRFDPDERPSLKGVLSTVERELIEKALAETNGNVSSCARLLKIQRTTLIERIKKYEIET